MPKENIKQLEELLVHLSEQNNRYDAPVMWQELAKDRIEKYTKSGLALQVLRCRESLSQKEVAKRSGVSQNEISKIENGKRVVGEKVARRLAGVLNADYRVLLSATWE